MTNEPIKVTELGLMPKTAVILENNGITTLDDLLLLDEPSLNEITGLSYHRATKVRECAKKWRNILEDDAVEYNAKQDRVDANKSVGAYLKTKDDSLRNIEMFAQYFSSPNATLEDVSSEFGVTRERVRQICKRYLSDIRTGFYSGKIDSVIMDAIEKAAEAKTEISMVDISDELLGKETTVRAVVGAFPERFELIKTRKLNGEWLVDKDEDVKNMIDYLSKILQERDAPMKIEDVLTIFPINEEMLLSMQNVIEKDGYVTLSTNKIVVGRIPKIKNYLLSICRPASIQEIADGTGLTANQVRGAVSDKNYFENVGKCVYDSVEINYLDLSPSKLAKNLLLAEGKPIKVQRIVKYVLKYDYSDLSERDVLIELFARGDSEVYHSDGYVLLKEWGREMIKESIPKREKYAVELRDAIRYIVREMSGVFDARMVLEKVIDTYGDSVSNNLSSVRSVLSVLVKRGEIVEVGKHTGCYRRP